MPRSHAGVEKNQTSFVYFSFYPFWPSCYFFFPFSSPFFLFFFSITDAANTDSLSANISGPPETNSSSPCLLTYHAPCWIVRLPQHIVGLRPLPPPRLLCPTFLSLWMVDGSKVTFLASKFLSLFLPSSNLESNEQLSSRTVRECSSPSISPPVSRPDTVWLVLWLITVLQGSCQIFVLRESARLTLFRFLTVPLLGSVLLAAVVSPFPRSLRGFRGSSLSFAVLAGLLPQLATYDHSFTFVVLQATSSVHHNICSKPNFTKSKWLSIFVANN